MNFTAEAVRYVLWERGQLLWKLHDGQLSIEKAYRSAQGKLFVADCSRQLGKSTWGAKEAVSWSLRQPGSRIRYATAFLTDLEQFILPAFDFILEDCPGSLRPRYRAQKSEFLFRNGSRIRLVGLDRKPNGLRGNRLDLVILDEAGFMNRLDYQYNSVLIPATTHVKNARIVMMSTQPESPDHEFVGFCDKASIEGGYVRLDVAKNPLLSAAQIDELAKECGGRESTAFRREYLCERIVEETRAIVPEFRERHVLESPVAPLHKFWHRLEALDTGVRDQTGCLFGYYDFERAKLCIEDEFALQGHEVTTRRIAALTREHETLRGYTGVHRRTADNDNLILLQDLGTEFGLHFAPTSKDELPAMVNKVRLWFQNNRIEIHPRCVRLIACLKAAIWNKQRDKFDRSKVHGHFDLLAALVYLVRNVPEHENPIPIGYGVDLSNQLFFRKERGLSDDAQTLKTAFGGFK